LIEIFAFLELLIGVLGLYGLVSFFARNKTKEIGVRKVLGADLGGLLWLFGKEFLKLLIFSFLLAAPIAWFAVYKYLEGYKFRVPIGLDAFLVTFLGTILLVISTISFISLKAVMANPIKSLRTE
jgi:ABC-type antimicrobial peptide transport system permease subunit